MFLYLHSLSDSLFCKNKQVLASRSKEIAMQNARLSELEIVVAKSNSTPIGGRNKNFDFASSEEYNNLKEENRVVSIYANFE